MAGDPLNVLLAHALLDLTREVERADPTVNVVLWSNLLRVVGDDGSTLKTLHLDARVSKRALKTVMTHSAVKEGLCVDDGGTVRLTDTGRLLRDAWRDAVADAEAKWPPAAALRGPLESLVGRLDLEHAHYPLPYGTADVSFTGGPGVDWKPVARDIAADTVSGLPLLSLLGQAFMAFAIDYESNQRGALHLGVHLAAVEWPRPLADAPPELHIVGDGKSGLERHGLVVVEDGVVRLTKIGEIVRASYAPVIADVEDSWRERYGDDVVTSLRCALEAADGALADGHADFPYVRHRPGVGFKEVSAASS